MPEVLITCSTFLVFFLITKIIIDVNYVNIVIVITFFMM